MRYKKQKAFTVIEIVMVIVIMSILALLAVNRISAYDEIKINLAADKLVADIRHVQNLAISNHEWVKVDFILGSEYYDIYFADSGGVKTSEATDPYTRATPFRVEYSDSSEYNQFNGVDISSASFDGDTSLMFTSLGRPQDGSGNDLTAQGSIDLDFKGYSATVTVEPNTGFCKKS